MTKLVLRNQSFLSTLWMLTDYSNSVSCWLFPQDTVLTSAQKKLRDTIQSARETISVSI